MRNEIGIDKVPCILPTLLRLTFYYQDLMLWEGHHVIGKRWVEISSKIFNGTRSENHIKNRWYSASFKKFISKEYGKDAYKMANNVGSAGRRNTEVIAMVGKVSTKTSKKREGQHPPLYEVRSESYDEYQDASAPIVRPQFYQS